MAKGARASTKKANNVRLKAGVFGPVESARNERLSAKLLELASQPKPKREDAVMEAEGRIHDHLYGFKSDKQHQILRRRTTSFQFQRANKLKVGMIPLDYILLFESEAYCEDLEMEVDVDPAKANTQSKPRRNRIEKKRSSRKASIVFPKYKKGQTSGKPKGKK